MSLTNQELEAKFYITNPKTLEERLLELGAELLQPRTHEYNLRYDTPDHELAHSYRLLRLRKDQAVRLTYKGPTTNQDGISVREEIEVAIGDYETAKELLHALGYEVTAVYEKYRTSYGLNQLQITIDEMPFGVFLEVEGEDVDGIRLEAEQVGLDWDAYITENYLQLFLRLKEALRLDFDEITFENFEGIEVEYEMMGISPADI